MLGEVRSVLAGFGIVEGDAERLTGEGHALERSVMVQRRQNLGLFGRQVAALERLARVRMRLGETIGRGLFRGRSLGGLEIG